MLLLNAFLNILWTTLFCKSKTFSEISDAVKINFFFPSIPSIYLHLFLLESKITCLLCRFRGKCSAMGSNKGEA